MTGASSGATGSEKLPSLISHVKDILPHLGDGFIEVGEKLCVDLGRGWQGGGGKDGGGVGGGGKGRSSVVEVGKRIPGIKSRELDRGGMTASYDTSALLQYKLQ